MGDKGGRCVGLTTLQPSCADRLEIWEPQPPGNLRACPGLLMGLKKKKFVMFRVICRLSFESLLWNCLLYYSLLVPTNAHIMLICMLPSLAATNTHFILIYISLLYDMCICL